MADWLADCLAEGDATGEVLGTKEVGELPERVRLERVRLERVGLERKDERKWEERVEPVASVPGMERGFGEGHPKAYRVWAGRVQG